MNNKNPWVVLIICMVVPALFICGVKGEELTEYKITMDPDDRYNVTWSFNGSEPQDKIIFTVEVETTGWVGLGFSPKGSMAGADIVVAWVDKNGTAHLQDMMADSNSLPTPDVSQDVTLISASELDGKTSVVFSRKLRTCDMKDRELKKDTTRLIYAYSFKDPTGKTLSVSDYHGASRRGAKSVYLFDPKPPKEHVPEDTIHLNIANRQYEVPSDDTTYYCSFHAAPEVDQKHHLIGLEPVITPGNEGIVHHMVLYSCWNVTLEHMREMNKTEGICHTAEMPEFASSCQTTIYAWAVGGGNYYFPEGTGYPLGTGDLDSPEFFMLEMHYDNPALKSGIVDSSGLRLIYTPKVRDIDVGMLSAGMVFGIMVPPGAEKFETTAYCHSACTKEWIPDEGITLFSYFLHAHLLGVKIKAEVFRDGKPGEILAVDNAYDFNFQENRLYHQYKKLYPGDTMKVTCIYDSTSRIEVTTGGFSSREEMCIGFFGYFPKQPLATCSSSPTFLIDNGHEIYSSLGVEAEMSKSSAPHALGTVDMQSSFANISWEGELISQSQEVVSRTPHVNFCMINSASTQTKTPTVFTVEQYKSFQDKGEVNANCDSMASSSSNIQNLPLAAVLICNFFVVTWMVYTK